MEREESKKEGIIHHIPFLCDRCFKAYNRKYESVPEHFLCPECEEKESKKEGDCK
jgi:hypothetical protein